MLGDKTRIELEDIFYFFFVMLQSHNKAGIESAEAGNWVTGMTTGSSRGPVVSTRRPVARTTLVKPMLGIARRRGAECDGCLGKFYFCGSPAGCPASHRRRQLHRKAFLPDSTHPTTRRHTWVTRRPVATCRKRNPQKSHIDHGPASSRRVRRVIAKVFYHWGCRRCPLPTPAGRQQKNV